VGGEGSGLVGGERERLQRLAVERGAGTAQAVSEVGGDVNVHGVGVGHGMAPDPEPSGADRTGVSLSKVAFSDER
jgi:hypothetical protein